MKTKLSIKNRFTGSIIFELETENNSTKKLVESMLLEFKGKEINQADMSNLNLSNINFNNSKFNQSEFNGSEFNQSEFNQSEFNRSEFNGSEFNQSEFNRSKFNDSNFNQSEFNGSEFNGSEFNRSKFNQSKFNQSEFNQSEFNRSEFNRSKFNQSKFNQSNFNQSEFNDSELDDITFNSLKNLITTERTKIDFFGRMLILKNEVKYLKEKLISGEIDGTSYDGYCACFIGTCANNKKIKYNEITGIKLDAYSPTEIWFFQIKKGDNPENSKFAKLTLDWIEEFEELI